MFESRPKNAVCPPSQIIQTKRIVWAANKSCVCLGRQAKSQQAQASCWIIIKIWFSLPGFHIIAILGLLHKMQSFRITWNECDAIRRVV